MRFGNEVSFLRKCSGSTRYLQTRETGTRSVAGMRAYFTCGIAYDFSSVEKNLFPRSSLLSVERRMHFMGHAPVTLWLTGLSAAGKTTLAYGLETALLEHDHACYVLDGDNIRTGLSRDLGFTATDRHENIRRVAEVARLLNDAGLIAITAFISPYRADRDMARGIVGAGRFLEVFVEAPLEVCEQRDPKGLYRRAHAGEIPEFTGVSAPYEAPEAPAFAVHTAKAGPEDCIRELLEFAKRKARID